MIGMVLSFAQADDADMDDLVLSSNDRILVLAPHPDDEILGAGGVLLRAVEMKLPVKVVFLTYGDSNQWSFLLYRKHPVIMPGAVKKMGLIRRDEALAAASVLGLDEKDLVFLGYPDFGTMNIWYAHWNDRPPLMGLLTRASKVPYQGALRPGALYKGEEILKDLRTVIHDFKPTKIFVSHPCDHNGDHLAFYLFTRVAVWDEGIEDNVEIYPYLIHYLGWPKPAGFKPDKPLVPPASIINTVKWKQYRLSPAEFELKKAALQAHKSQYTSTPKYLLSFIRPNEIFGDFPVVHLHPNQHAPVFKVKSLFISAGELPEELNSREKTAFVGVEWRFVRWEGENLIISIELSKPLAENVEASIYIFGYNKDVPFKMMPKISVNLGVLSYSVYDKSVRIDQGAVKVKRSPNEVEITVPLKLIGDPDRILTSARTYLGNVPLGSASWMVVELN